MLKIIWDGTKSDSENMKLLELPHKFPINANQNRRHFFPKYELFK